MILVDTSVWIHHLRHGDNQLAALLDAGQVLCHPFVIGELACGNLENRQDLLALLYRLPSSVSASDPEVLSFIEQRDLMGRGIGYIDAHLLASLYLSTPAQIWTRDKRLAAIARELSVAH